MRNFSRLPLAVVRDILLSNRILLYLLYDLDVCTVFFYDIPVFTMFAVSIECQCLSPNSADRRLRFATDTSCQFGAGSFGRRHESASLMILLSYFTTVSNNRGLHCTSSKMVCCVVYYINCFYYAYALRSALQYAVFQELHATCSPIIL